MNWPEYVRPILDFQLLQLGGNPITVLHLAMFAITLIVTHVLARSARRTLTAYVLAEIEPTPRYVIIRFTQYLV